MVKWISIFWASLLAILMAASVASSAPPYKVIVHPDTAQSEVDRKLLAEIFLKRATRWPGGEAIKPVDQSRESAVRRSFSELVVGRSIAAVRSYWQQQIFSGRDLPPPELDSDAAVVRYVTSHPGAIGYISATADPGTAKVLVLP